MSKKVITSWASVGRENYPAAQLRLIRSCIDAHWDGEYLIRTLDGYVDEYLGVKIYQGQNPQSTKWPLNNNHAEIPYGFKPTAIQECRERGFQQVIWMDSSMRLLKYPSEWLDRAAIHGVCAFNNLGHPWRNYVSDVAVEKLRILPAHMDKVDNIMACCLIFDFDHPKTHLILDEWLERSHDGLTFQNGYGSTRPEFIAHRHDQAALAAILHNFGVPIAPYGGLAYQPHQISKEYGEVTFLNKGID